MAVPYLTSRRHLATIMSAMLLRQHKLRIIFSPRESSTCIDEEKLKRNFGDSPATATWQTGKRVDANSTFLRNFPVSRV